MKNVLAQLNGMLSKLPPEKRRLAMLGLLASAVLVFSVVAMMAGNQVVSEKRPRAAANNKSVEFYPLTGKDTTKLSGDVLTERIKTLEGEIDRLKTGEVLPGQVRDPNAPPPPPQPKGAAAEGAGITLGQAVGVPGDAMPSQLFAPGIVPPPVRKKTAQADESIKAVASAEPKNDPLFPEPKGKEKGTPGTVVTGNDGFGSTEAPAKKLEIREISEEQEKGEKGPLAGAFNSTQGDIQATGLFMPAGSIISGVLITGMDAPTANQGRKDPFPVLMRIKAETLMPNHMTMDIRECFLIASGYGDMSTERAFLRSETVSCVTQDGKVIEAGLNAYAVGEDGKNGLRGRLVSKTGSMVAKSLMAGFLAGAADVFKPQKIPTVNVNSTGGSAKQGVFEFDTDIALHQGALGGMNSAMSRIADYYLDMAKSMFPIVEIDAGRKIDFVVIKGTKLALQSGAKGNQKPGAAGAGQQQQRSSSRNSYSNPNSLNGMN